LGLVRGVAGLGRAESIKKIYAQGLAVVRDEQHCGLSTATNKHIDLSLIRIGHLLLGLAPGSPQTRFSQLAVT
jgi:hypothetical protein